MKKMSLLLFSSLALSACSSTGVQPIVIDLSKPSPSPTPSPQPTPTATPAPERPAPVLPSPAAAQAAPAPSPDLVRPAVTPGPAPGAMTPEAVVERQLAAYNRRDVEGFVASYAEDAIVYDPPERVRDAGIEAIRRTYAKAFADAPGARATVSQRLIQGNFIVDQESVSGLPGGATRSATVIYEVRDGKIRRAWILR